MTRARTTTAEQDDRVNAGGMAKVELGEAHPLRPSGPHPTFPGRRPTAAAVVGRAAAWTLASPTR